MIIINENSETFSLDGFLYLKDNFLIEFSKVEKDRGYYIKNIQINIKNKYNNEPINDKMPLNCSLLRIENNQKFNFVQDMNNYFKNFFSELICGGDYWEATNW